MTPRRRALKTDRDGAKANREPTTRGTGWEGHEVYLGEGMEPLHIVQRMRGGNQEARGNVFRD